MGKTGKALKKRRLAQFAAAHVVTKTAIDDPDSTNELDEDSHALHTSQSVLAMQLLYGPVTLSVRGNSRS